MNAVNIPLNLISLIGKDLAGFRIVSMIELWQLVDLDHPANSIGFISGSRRAEILARVMPNSAHTILTPSLVITNGEVGRRLGSWEPIKILDYHYELARICERTLDEISPYPLTMLGFQV